MIELLGIGGGLLIVAAALAITFHASDKKKARPEIVERLEKVESQIEENLGGWGFLSFYVGHPSLTTRLKEIENRLGIEWEHNLENWVPKKKSKKTKVKK